MQLIDVMIAWNPNGDAKVGQHPDTVGWTKQFQMTAGACYSNWRTFTEDQRQKILFVEFHAMVVRDGVDPQVAHRAFMEIQEYRELIAPDIEGAAI